MSTRVPAIPAPTSANLLQVSQAVKNVLDVREGLLGDPLDANVTFRDLIDAGVASARPGVAQNSRVTPVLPAWVEQDGYDPTQDFTVPPKPENATATGLFAAVQLQWSAATYRNHSYAEIWRAETNVIGNAVLIGTSDTSFYVDTLGTSASRYYWIRFVSQANIKGPFNGVDGQLATTATDPALVLNSLTGQITETHLYAALNSRINLIDGADTLAGSVNARLLAEAQARGAAITTEQTARQSADNSLSQQITTLTAAVNTADANLSAAIQAEATARANADTAISSSVTALSSQVNDAATGLPATRSLLLTDYYTKAGTDTAISSATTTLQSSINNQLTGYATTASLQTEATTRANADNSLFAQYTVKTDLAGRVAGFGLASEINTAGANTSTFAIVADRFYIAAPNDYTQEATPTGATAGKVWYEPSTKQTFRYDGTSWVAFNPIIPFVVQATPTTINGVSVPAGVYMDAAFIKDGTITNAKIGNAAIDNAKIASLDAAKINTGFLSADRIQAGTLDAKIANIDAAVITSGTIAQARIGDGTITNAKIGNVIQSNDYVAGSAGWKIDKTGQMEMNNAVFRGALSAASGTFVGSMTAGSININNKFTVDSFGNTVIRDSTTGARLEISNSVIKVFDGNGVVRVKIGNLLA